MRPSPSQFRRTQNALLAVVAALAVALLATRAEEPPTLAPEAKKLVEDFFAALNAGEWDRAVSFWNTPFFMGDDIENDLGNLKDAFRSGGEGSSDKVAKLEAVDVKEIKPRLDEKARQFLTQSDQLVRIRIEVHQGQKTDTTQALFILRKTQDKLLITGGIDDPDEPKK